MLLTDDATIDWYHIHSHIGLLLLSFHVTLCFRSSCALSQLEKSTRQPRSSSGPQVQHLERGLNGIAWSSYAGGCAFHAWCDMNKFDHFGVATEGRGCVHRETVSPQL